MAKIQINISTVRAANQNVPGMKSSVGGCRQGVEVLRKQIAPEIAARKNIAQRMVNVTKQMQEIESQLNELYVVTSSCAAQYEDAEKENNRNASKFL